VTLTKPWDGRGFDDIMLACYQQTFLSKDPAMGMIRMFFHQQEIMRGEYGLSTG
jgi:hypothetical protein